MTTAPGFEYPEPTHGGYTNSHLHTSTSIGPAGLADTTLNLTNTKQPGTHKRHTPQTRRNYLADTNALDQLIHALAQLHNHER